MAKTSGFHVQSGQVRFLYCHLMKVLGRCVDLHRTRKQCFQYRSLFFPLRNVEIATVAATIQATIQAVLFFFVFLTAKPWRISTEMTLIGDLYVSVKMENGQDRFTHVIFRDLALLLCWKKCHLSFSSLSHKICCGPKIFHVFLTPLFGQMMSQLLLPACC